MNYSNYADSVIDIDGLGSYKEEPDGDVNNEWIILHEYGHHVMDHAYGGVFPISNCPTPHYITQQSSQNCGWTEGWANFVPHLVTGDEVMSLLNHSVSYDIEEPRYGNIRGTDSSFEQTERTEGRVAATLWDLHDSGRTDENIRRDFDRYIWDAFSDLTPAEYADNFREFQENWDKKHPSSAEDDLREVMILNTIVYLAVPDQIDDLKAVSVTTRQATLTWSIPSDNGHQITRQEIVQRHGLAEETIMPLSANETIYTAPNLVDNNAYSFFVRVYNEHGFSASNVENIITAQIPNPPKNIRSVNVSHDMVEISWEAPDDGNFEVTQYEIFRAASPFVSLANVSASITTYADTSVSAATDYRYKIRAHSQHDSSTFSQTIPVSTPTQSPGICMPPAITAPEDVTVEATAVLTPASDVGLGDAVTSDDVDADPTITNDAPESFPLGDTTVTWTATDSCGNAATDTQTVTIRDTTLPSITAPPDVTAEAAGVLTIVSIGQATATDIADPDPTITNDAPASFPLGDTTVTWIATDGSGNAATATQAVTIRDTTPPQITAPADHTAEAAGMMTVLNAGDYGTPTVSDIADPNPMIANDAPESFSLGNTTITWTATDSSDNVATATQTVTIRDTTPPAISDLRDISVDDPAGRGVAVSYDAPTATDLVDATVAVSCTHEPGSTFAPGFTGVACTATDGSENLSRVGFIIHVDASDSILDVSQTVSTGRSTWSVTGPDRVFAGQTFEYTVTLEDGARPRLESLAVYSTAPERDLGWHDPDADCQTVICAGFPGQKHDTYKIASDEDSPYTAMHNKMKKSRSSHTVLLQPAVNAPAGTQATVGMMDSGNNQVGGIHVTVMPPSAKTITGEHATWRITGPDRIFPGQTFEYTVTLEGTRHQHDALAVYSRSLTVDDFGGFPEGSGCGTTVCADFPGQRRRTMELDNHAGSAYDVRYHTINALGYQYAILLRTADDAEAGGAFWVGLVDGDGVPKGGIRVTIADPVTVTAPYEELVAGLSFEGSLADATGNNNGTAAAGDVVTYVPGRIGRALQLDNSSHVTLAGEADFDFGWSDPLSIAFWLKQDAPVSANSMVLSKVESIGHPGSYVWIWDGAPNRVLLMLHNGSSFINVHTPAHLNMSDGSWHHMAFTYDGSGAKDGLNAYVDGEHRDFDHFRRGLGLTGNMTNGHAFALGASGLREHGMADAALDELRVYDTELSARQVRLLHAAGLG